MKRVAAITCVVLAAAALLLVGTGADGDSGAYRVRAIFMNAFSVIPGEDVKVAGVKVGKIESMDVTPQHRAAVVLRIDRAGFDDFRADAECTIRPQSLIGEKFVECTPTQPRPEDQPPAPPLPAIKRGTGKGQHLLPVTQTSAPVDLDLINNTLRLPFRQRLTIILNELGTGLAGRGDDLRVAVRNADPALKETDKVLALLSRQNRVLERLARDGDTILAPLARDRARVASFISNANTTAEATAERSSDLEGTIARLPAFLRELRPTMVRLGALSDQATPVFGDLGVAAPGVNRFVRQLGPFSQAGTPALQSLGDAADVGGPALTKSQPIIEQTGALAKSLEPVSANLAALTTSLQSTGGIERAMDYLFFQVSAINGFDSVGHYLRAGLILNTCSQYAIVATPECRSGFTSGAGARAAAAPALPGYADSRRSPALRRFDAVMHGVDPTLASRPAGPAAPAPAPAPAPAATRAAASPDTSTQASGPQQALLDYLLGGGG
jgi:phospholipid/cholesterol/gamma-HCH transport system substrate-binding protein